MHMDFLLNVFRENKTKDAVIWKDRIYSYEWLLERIYYWQTFVQRSNIQTGTVIILEADFSPNSISLFLALVEKECIIVPMTKSVEVQKPEFVRIAQGEYSFCIDDNDDVNVTKLPYSANHKLYRRLTELNHPGLVLFSSGSTGKSKAAVHDLIAILEKFKKPRYCFRAISFLLYDHIGGINTMLYILSNAGCLVTVHERSPDSVLGLIDKYRIELLPTSPTFINLVLLSKAYKRYKLDSLNTITYGTEPMLEATLRRFHRLFPKIKLQQTYGLSEVGILRSKSKGSDSLWVKIGGEGFETRIVDGILQIKAKSTMLGYLNAPNPFTVDGWMNTGDLVEINGDYIKILGRKSEIINVGGEKVYPSQVENVIQELENVKEITVYGEKNFITGEIVCAKVSLTNDENPKKFVLRLKKHCRGRLQNHQVPVKVEIMDKKQHSNRFKKIRYSEHGS